LKWLIFTIETDFTDYSEVLPSKKDTTEIPLNSRPKRTINPSKRKLEAEGDGPPLAKSKIKRKKLNE
jgi:hypothetical protein